MSSPPARAASERSPRAARAQPGGSIAVIAVGSAFVARVSLHALRAGGLHDLHLSCRPLDLADGGVRGERPERVPRGLLTNTSQRSTGPGVELHEYPSPGTDWAGSWLGGCELCLLCADIVEAGTALEVNARCVQHRVRLLPALMMGTVAQVGPLIQPGMSACLQCVDLRLQAATGRSCLADFGPAEPRLAAVVGEVLAARALRLVAGEVEPPDRRVSYLWRDGTSTHHPVLRSAHCPQCGNAGRLPAYRVPAQLGFVDQPSEPGRIRDVQGEFVDPVTGPIRSLERFAPDPEDPAVRHWIAALADLGWARAGHPILPCGGNNLDDAKSQAAALGEALERMSACQPLAAEMLVASHRDVARDAVVPWAWDLFDPATRAMPGFPYPRLSPDDAVSWTWGWSLTRSRPLLVPASRVFVPFDPRSPADHADYPTLSGFATGSTLAEAALAGVLETVERDALMIAWVNRLSPPRLDLDRSSPDGIGDLVAAFADANVDVRCLMLMLDLAAPVVLAMARGAHADEPAMVLSAAAGLDPASACRRALAELAANRLNVRAAMQAAHAEQAHGRQETSSATTNGLLYADPDMAVHLDCWWNAPTTISLAASGQAVRPMVGLHRMWSSIAAVGLEAIIVDLTPPEIRDLGLFVVKALVPGCYPLNFDSRWPHLGGQRLRFAPVASGLLDSPRAFHDLNRLPVPFS